MDKIEIHILDEHPCSGGMMLFLAKLTQRGNKIKNMNDLISLYDSCVKPDNYKAEVIKNIAALPHGTIKRFTPITIAIVGASRRFLAQIRTHQVGITFVSASLQYSNYTGAHDFVVPYALLDNTLARTAYNKSNAAAMETYEMLCKNVDNDTAGYAAPQGLRNVLILQANHEAFAHLIRLRACRRNTNETAYVVTKIWEELLSTSNGREMFATIGPDCVHGTCREGKMSCSKPLFNTDPKQILKECWPLLYKER